MTDARAPRLVSCVGVETDLDLLAHFLDHYRGLGLAPGDMHLILNAAAPDRPGLARARAILAEAGCAAPEVWIGPYTSRAMWQRRRELQARVAGPRDWVISADVDEFHAYPEPLPAFLARCARMGVDCVQGPFVDRLAEGGRLAPVAPAPAILEQFPVLAEVSLSIAGTGRRHDRFGTVKIMALRGAILPSQGGHHPQKGQKVRYLYGHPLGAFAEIERSDFRFAVPTRVHHVHWTASLPGRLERRLATPGVSPAGAEYGRKQLDHIARHGGIALDRVALPPPAASRDWTRDLARLRRRGFLKARLGPLLARARRALGR